MNRYQLIRGFDTHEDAQEYADRLPTEAKAKVVPYNSTLHRRGYAFAVDVSRDYLRSK